MTAHSGLIQSYINTNPLKTQISDKILLIEPYNIVAYSVLGTDVSKFNFTNAPQYTYQWLEDTFNNRTDSVISGLSTSTTTTTCTITTAALFQPGDVWLIESEQVWVSAISGSVITITRGWGGTTPALHADGTAMTRISRARHEGDDADDSPSTEVSTNYNYSQIFQRTVNVSRSRQLWAEYGVADWLDYLQAKYVKELMMDLSRLPYYGRRYAGAASTARSAGGFRTFITDNLTYATSTGATGGTPQTLTRTYIDNTLQNIYEDGGDPGIILTGAHAQRKINDMYIGSVSTERSESIGGVLITKLLNPISGKLIDVVVDRQCPTNEMWILSPEHISYYAIDPFFYEELAKTGDADKGEVVGEYGFIVAYDKSHGAVLEFATS